MGRGKVTSEPARRLVGVKRATLKHHSVQLVARAGKFSLCSISPWSDQFWNTQGQYGRPI